MALDPDPQNTSENRDTIEAFFDEGGAVEHEASADVAMDSPSWLDRRAAGRLQARKVRRLVRHVEPWSVMKIALLFYFCMWIILTIAGVLLWRVAQDNEVIDNIEGFIESLFALKSFEFEGDEIFRGAALGGLVMVVAGTGFTVLSAVLFNLISDLMGGIRMTVVEEESARPRAPRRTVKQRKNGGGAPPAAIETQPPVNTTSPG